MSSSTPDSPFAYGHDIASHPSTSERRPTPSRAFSSSAAPPFNSAALRRGTSQPPGAYAERDRERDRAGRGGYDPSALDVEEGDELRGLYGGFEGMPSGTTGGGSGRTWSTGMGSLGGAGAGSGKPGIIGLGGARGPYGGDGSAALRSRWSGVLGLHGGNESGMQTRSSSFSAGETRRIQVRPMRVVCPLRHRADAVRDSPRTRTQVPDTPARQPMARIPRHPPSRPFQKHLPRHPHRRSPQLIWAATRTDTRNRRRASPPTSRARALNPWPSARGRI